MSGTELPVNFNCGDERLLGVLTLPPPNVPASGTAVLVVVGGPQYRVGSHRQFVEVARALAAQGHSAMRFDVRGMGDSTGAQRSFEQLDEDIAAAIDALHTCIPGVARTVLWGLCDGASASLLYLEATSDPRIHGLCLLNPWVRSQASLARTRVKHYYFQRLRQGQFWAKLFSGEIAAGALMGLLSSLRAARGAAKPSPLSYQQRMASALAAFPGAVLLLLSENDYTAKEFVEFTRVDARWKAALERPQMRKQVVLGADHTLSGAAAKVQVLRIMEDWLRDEFRGPAISAIRQAL